MPVANVPTTRLLGGVVVRVDAQSSACASRRGGRTSRGEARSASGRCGAMASNLPGALVVGCIALRGSWDRLSPATTVDGSWARGSSIRLVSGGIGDFPFASLPLEGLKRRALHVGRCARPSKSAVMPISRSWSIDSARRQPLAQVEARAQRRWCSRRRRSGRERRRLTPWARVALRVSPITAVPNTGVTGIDCPRSAWSEVAPGRSGDRRQWVDVAMRPARERGHAALQNQRPQAATAPERRDPPGDRVSRDHMPAVHALRRRRAPHAARQSRLPGPLSTAQEAAGEEVQPGHAGAGGTRAQLCSCLARG
jgi:hypothetical protein